MKSLSTVVSVSSPHQKFPKFHKPISRNPNFPHPSHQIHFPSTKNLPLLKTLVKISLPFSSIELFNSLPCFASETLVSNEQVSDKINLEAIVVSIDDFFNRYPFFVAGCAFIWLVGIPLSQAYLNKYRYISAIDAFKKLKEIPNVEMLDIRDKKSLAYLGTPNLKFLNKNARQVQFVEGDEDGFVKQVKGKFVAPNDTIVCVLDNFDGNSMKVAELLFKNGFKEVYAIRGGVRGKNGWMAIQENLLPPSVHIYPKKKGQKSQQIETNGGVNLKIEDSNGVSSSTSAPVEKTNVTKNCEYYSDLKPPASPTPSKPQS